MKHEEVNVSLTLLVLCGNTDKSIKYRRFKLVSLAGYLRRAFTFVQLISVFLEYLKEKCHIVFVFLKNIIGNKPSSVQSAAPITVEH